MGSSSFGSARRPSGKKFRDGTIAEALDDLYSDIDGAFSVAETTGAALRANLHMDVVPTAGDTVSIGADTYEFRGAAGQMSNDAFIGVLIGGDAQTSLANLGNAINGAGTGATDGILDNAGTAPCALVNGTEPIGALAPGANDMPITCLGPDGTETAGFPAANIVLADNLSDGGDQFNLPALPAASTTQTGSRSCVVGPVTYDAVTVVAGSPRTIEGVLPFLPRTHTIAVSGAAGVDVATAGVAVTYAGGGGGAAYIIDIGAGVDAGSLTADGTESVTVVFFE